MRQLPKIIRTAGITVVILTIGLIIGVPLKIAAKVRASATDTDILSSSWSLNANKEASEKYQKIDNDILTGKKSLRLTYNLHGSCLIQGDASAIVFDQQGWKFISLANYGKNCYDGEQSVEISLTDFKDIATSEALTVYKLLDGPFHVRFWLNKAYTIEIKKAVLVGENSSTADNPTTSPMPNDSTVPLTTGFRGITDGEKVSGKIYVSYQVNEKTTKKVDFYIDNDLKSTENYYPYFLGGDNSGTPKGWDTKQLSNASHQLKVTVTSSDNKVSDASLSFNVDNSVSNISPTITPTITPIISVKPSITPIPTVKLTPTITVTPIPTNTGTSSLGWQIKSIDAMKDTKDAICGQRPQSWIERWVDKAVELGANYVAISTPYEDPSCGNAREYTKMWITAIRSRGLKVWHRQMPLAFEGIYSTSKSAAGKDISIITNYIKNNPDMYAEGDIFTPIPEPQNGGISGVTYCANGYCQFSNPSDFNSWLRQLMTESSNAMNTIGLGGGKVKIGYFGFDGFVAWGANNPDWQGILEDATVSQMGNITVDHYPEAIGSTMKTGLDELQARYPGVPVVIGEWGTINNTNVEQEVKDSMGAAKRPGVIGFNYWQFGPGGAGEQLINDDFSNHIQFDEVQSFYK
jgi:hypothetical protein